MSQKMFQIIFLLLGLSGSLGISSAVEGNSSNVGSSVQREGKDISVHIAGMYTLAASIISAVGGYLVGNQKGRRGKEKGFDYFSSPLKLDEKVWDLEFEDSDGSKVKGNVSIEQSGCRISGKVSATEPKRTWVMEGAASDRAICYIYTDQDPNKESFGAVVVKMNSGGEFMEGKWIGFDANTGELEDGGEVKLK